MVVLLALIVKQTVPKPSGLKQRLLSYCLWVRNPGPAQPGPPALALSLWSQGSAGKVNFLVHSCVVDKIQFLSGCWAKASVPPELLAREASLSSLPHSLLWGAGTSQHGSLFHGAEQVRKGGQSTTKMDPQSLVT